MTATFERTLGSKVIVLILLTSLLSIPASADYKASISLYGEKTDVYIGEDIIAKLSIVNLVSNPKMHAQVIILPPSGMSVSSAIFTKTSAGQFEASFDIDPSGGGREIEIVLIPNQAGEFNVKGRVVYYFGDDKENTQDYSLDLPVSVRRPTVLTDSKINAPRQNEVKKGMMGFEVILLGVGMIALVLIVSVIIIYMLKR